MTDTLQKHDHSLTKEKGAIHDADLERIISVKLGSCEDVNHAAARTRLSPIAMVALSFNICNSWVAIATSLAIAISAGGSVTLLYGIICSCVVYACVGISLAEMISVYPTPGGQYHFTSILASKRWSRGLSYICGSISMFSWIALTAAATILGAQMVIALPESFVEGYTPKPWHYFVVYQAINIAMLLYNLFALRVTPWIHNIGFALTVTTFAVVTITCVARSTKQDSDAVWTTFHNTSGWPDAVTFLTGLSTPCFMYAGIDSTLHLTETCENPKKVVPRALMTTVAVGVITGFGFSIAMCYGITDLSALVNTSMPIYDIWKQTTKSSAAATVFLVALLMIILFVIVAMQQTAGCLTWSLARDDALLFSKKLGIMHDRLGVPVWSLVTNSVLVFLAGCVYLISSTAFSALINSSIILQIVSFSMPCALLMLRGRSERVLPRDRAFSVPSWLGWIANAVVVIAAIIETVFFDFPAAIPISVASMNYTCVVLAALAILSCVNWFAHGRRSYQGPTLQMQE
ncbi:hypothetical protein MBLNU13_g06259t2 [Cladosporium sp. NU13]